MSDIKSEKRTPVRFIRRVMMETRLFSEIKELDQKLDLCYTRLGIMTYNIEKGVGSLPQDKQKIIDEIEKIKKSIEKRRKKITMFIKELKKPSI